MVFSGGARRRVGGVTVVAAPGAGDRARIGLVVGRRVGKAVVRNRVKRRLRAALAEIGPAPGHDYVIVAVRAVAEAPFPKVVGWLKAALARAGEVAMLRETGRTPPSAAARAALKVLSVYQRSISPAFGRRCRYLPTCSEYARLAVERFGAARGAAMALRRLLRCRPFGASGFDPVPPARMGAESC